MHSSLISGDPDDRGFKAQITFAIDIPEITNHTHENAPVFGTRVIVNEYNPGSIT